MSKIVAEFDTKEKTLSITMDGKSIDNVSSAEFYAGWDEKDEFHAGITTVTKIDEEDVTQVMRIVAEDQIESVQKSSDLHRVLARRLFPNKCV